MDSLFVQISAGSLAWLALGLTLLVLGGCGGAATPTPMPEPLGSCSLDLGQGISDEEAIQAVLRAEGELMVAQAIEPLMALWAPGSRVVDAKNSADDRDDDQTWSDKDAIRHRYVRTVFPGAPAAAQPADLEIAIDRTGEHPVAVVRATTTIGDEIAPAGDRWELIQVEGCWLIRRLTYNLEAR